MTASISARNRSRRVTLPFWLHAIPANVRCSPIPNLPTPSLDARSFYHVERLAQSFPRWHDSKNNQRSASAGCVGRPQPRFLFSKIDEDSVGLSQRHVPVLQHRRLPIRVQRQKLRPALLSLQQSELDYLVC